MDRSRTLQSQRTFDLIAFFIGFSIACVLWAILHYLCKPWVLASKVLPLQYIFTLAIDLCCAPLKYSRCVSWKAALPMTGESQYSYLYKRQWQISVCSPWQMFKDTQTSGTALGRYLKKPLCWLAFNWSNPSKHFWIKRRWDATALLRKVWQARLLC